jgi:hypothetical protein
VLGLAQGVERAFKDPGDGVGPEDDEVERRDRPDDRELRGYDVHYGDEDQPRTERHRGRDEDGSSEHFVLVAQREEPDHRLVQAEPGDENEEPHGRHQGGCNTHVCLRVEPGRNHPEEEPEPRSGER